MEEKTRKQRYNQIISATTKDLNACVVELADSYLKDFPNSQGAWDMYGFALFKIDKFKAARKATLKAIELIREPDKQIRLSWLFCRLGDIDKSSGKYKKALEWYEKAHKTNPNEATFLIYQGAILLRLEKFEDATKVFIKATNCKEGCIDEAFYNLGVSYLIQKNYVEAQLSFQKALEIDPKYKEAKQQLKDVTQILTILNNK